MHLSKAGVELGLDGSDVEIDVRMDDGDMESAKYWESDMVDSADAN